MTASDQPSAKDVEDRTVPAKSRFISLSVIGFALVALLFAWLWYDSQAQVSALRAELGQRMRETEADSRDARLSARQAQEAMREALAKVAQLDLRLTEYQNHQASLEALYQDLSRSHDDWVLAEIEQLLTIASQQLQLGGNASAALAALQTADARLARLRRPQFLPLRKALARDIERLRAAPGVDVTGLAATLDEMIAAVDSLPLAQDMRPQTTGAAKAAPEGMWERLAAEVADELRQLVRIRNVDGADPALLSPSQAYFLRENLKLRLLNARVGLIARDEAAYRSDLKVAASWLERYFDVRSRAGAAMTAGLRRLGAVAPGPLFPTINESLAAVRSYKAPRDGGPR
jgi:uroporphyrin-III C-methyltransferase